MWFFIRFHFLKKIIKKYFSFWHLICSFEKKKKNWRYDPRKILKNRKMLKKTSLSSAATWIAFLAWKMLKFGFLYLYKSYIELNFLSKNINPESIGILSSKLWLKYETGAEDNTNSTSSSIFFQNFKWGSTSNLFQLI